MHDNVLALANELAVCFDDCLKELEVLDMPAMGLNAVDEVLYHLITQLAAQLDIVLKDGTHCLRLQQLR